MLSLVTEGMELDGAPYLDASALVEDQLRVVRARLECARTQRATEAPDTTAIEILTAESAIAARLRASDRRVIPIIVLRDQFSLTPTEERVLWILVAHEVCPLTRSLVRGLNSEQTLEPTTDTLRRVAYAEARVGITAWLEFSERDSTLRRFGLIARTDGGTDTTPPYRQTWKVSDRVLDIVHGNLELDAAFAEFATLAQYPAELRDLVAAPQVKERLALACKTDSIVIAYGNAGSGRRSLLEAVLAADKRCALVIDGRAIAKDRQAARVELRALARECSLLDAVPMLRDLDAVAASGDIPDRLDLVEAEFRGLVVATANAPVARRWKRGVTQVEVESLSGADRARVWSMALPALGPDRADDLATLYPLAPGLIHAVGIAVTTASASAEPTTEEIASGLRSILDNRLAGLATRVVITQTWDDMVLPDDQIAAIVELMARVKERRTVYERWGFADKVGRGLGVSALFSGPPGTGKTMAAGLIARDLGVELYRVDISKIVSKWIGETEKNLAALFDAAEAGHAILLFDEADALFGKRTEVKSSNDRYANQEVNFLLQRLESFAGIVLLTTNHETAIDEAFRRRLSLRVKFPMPDLPERTKLWRAMLPKHAPTHGVLGLDRLAEHYIMSGGYIRNAVVRAAFLAAAQDSPITAEHLTSAAQLEYEAMGKIASKL